jgi:DNA-directed RNA polymerase specialized sigma24 family protein
VAQGTERPDLGMRFPTTSWTMISAAGGVANGSRQALNDLCAAYWPPVYAFIRRKGHSPDEAEELTQEFFARILERGGLAAADRQRGKFRSFLLASVSNYLANEWDRATARKRGSGIPALSLDVTVGEERLHREPCDQLTPEALFERQWALTLLSRVLDRLREEQTVKGQPVLFARLQGFLTGDQERGCYESVALDLKMSEGSARIAVHRLRRRYGELVREEIMALVNDPGEVEAEIRYLLDALGRT